MNIASYKSSIILISSIVLGGVVGLLAGPKVFVLKPLGIIFLHLLYTIIIPLIFFSVSNAIASMDELKRLRKILIRMLVVFFSIGSLAAFFMIGLVILFHPTQGVVLKLGFAPQLHTIHLGDQLANMFTVPNIAALFLPKNMLALIVMSVLVGLATALAGEKAKPFTQFLQAGADVFMKLIGLLMYYAPIGFFAFFAVLVAKLGPALLVSYCRSMLIYYGGAIVFFVVGYSALIFFLNSKVNVKTFWKNSIPPLLTALATCSSAASIPVNMQALEKMKIPRDVNETVVPLGTMVHKEGSVMGGVLKIAFLFGIFHMHFLTPFGLTSTWLVAILVGTVMGAIPSGGMLGEMLILAVYGFPPQALFIIATISILIDPLATAINVLGNTLASVFVAKMTHRKEMTVTVTSQPTLLGTPHQNQSRQTQHN